MEPKHVLASVFFALGGWALLGPAHVLRTVMLRPEVTDTTTLLVGCVGAQAMMTGSLFVTARMTRALYMVFAVGMIPFLVLFNYQYLYVKPMFNNWMWADVAGTVVILLTCLWGLASGAGLEGAEGGGGGGRSAKKAR